MFIHPRQLEMKLNQWGSPSNVVKPWVNMSTILKDCWIKLLGQLQKRVTMTVQTFLPCSKDCNLGVSICLIAGSQGLSYTCVGLYLYCLTFPSFDVCTLPLSPPLAHDKCPHLWGKLHIIWASSFSGAPIVPSQVCFLFHLPIVGAGYPPSSGLSACIWSLISSSIFFQSYQFHLL